MDCHFLLQNMNKHHYKILCVCVHVCVCVCVCVCVYSVTQSYLTLCDPMDCNPTGSSVHGILQARILECPALLQGIFPTQGSNLHLLCLLLCRQILYPLSHWEAQ